MGEPASALLEAIDQLLAGGDDLFGVRDTRVALVLGVVHGLKLEQDLPTPREAAVAGARAGYALRCAEERVGEVVDPAPLRALIEALEQERADLPHWEAMQIVAWELVEDPELERFADLVDARELDGHAGRPMVVETLAEAALKSFGTGTPIGALSEGDARRAVVFGYGLRIAERSLPDDDSRLLRDG